MSNIDKAIAYEWIADKLDNKKFELSFILLNSKQPYLYDWLKEKGIECYYIPHFGKKSYPITTIKTFLLLRKIKPKVIHTHLFDANLIGLLTAKILTIKKRIYTRHHSTYHHDYFPKAVKWDKLANSLATHVIATSKNVKKVLLEQEKVPLSKVHLIYYGFDIKRFQNLSVDQIDLIKSKYQLNSSDTPIIGVISRQIKWKGIPYIIYAFKQLLNNYPNAKLLLANALGPDKKFIQSLLEKYLPNNSYIEIPFENDLFSLYQLFDVHVHVPINPNIEAFGQTYVEALAAGIPSVFTLSGIAHEFIKNEHNALVVSYKNSDKIFKSIVKLLENKQFSKQLIENGKNSIKPFSLNLFVQKLECLYG